MNWVCFLKFKKIINLELMFEISYLLLQYNLASVHNPNECVNTKMRKKHNESLRNNTTYIRRTENETNLECRYFQIQQTTV